MIFVKANDILALSKVPIFIIFYVDFILYFISIFFLLNANILFFSLIGGVFLAITTHYTNEGSGFVVPSACAKSGKTFKFD